MVNYVAIIFKVLFLSIMMMIIMDLSLVVADTLSVNNRLNSIQMTMKHELAKNNSIPDTIRPLFEEQLDDTVENSNVASRYTSNLNRSISIDGVTYPAVNEANVQDYGSLLKLVVVVEMKPRSILLFTKKPELNDDSMLKVGTATFYLRKIDDVPALRFLK